MKNWRILKIKVDTCFRPGTGQNSGNVKEFIYNELNVNQIIAFECFQIRIKDITLEGLNGSVKWSYDYLTLDAGSFQLNEEQSSFSTDWLNISYDTFTRLCIEIVFDVAVLEKMKTVIGCLDPDCAVVWAPASEDEIRQCNGLLKENQMPFLPSDYVDFLKICNGLEFNGMIVFGTKDCQIVKQNVQMYSCYSYYPDCVNLIFFGRIDDDIYVFNAGTCRYEARDINGFEIWDSYDSFNDFFFNEMMKWLRL